MWPDTETYGHTTRDDGQYATRFEGQLDEASRWMDSSACPTSPHTAPARTERRRLTWVYWTTQQNEKA